MSLITELSSDFSSAVRSRGSDYFQEGRVKIKTGSDWEIYAKVRGSRTYNVDLSIEEDELVVHCDCPDFETEPCKHLWATLLAANEKGYLRGDGNLGPLEIVPEFDDDYDFYNGNDDGRDDEEYDDEDEYDDDQPVQNVAPMFDRGRRSKEKLPSWREQLAALGRSPRMIIAGRGD